MNHVHCAAGAAGEYFQNKNCQNCLKNFANIENLEKHLQNCKREIDCPTCGRTFANSSYKGHKQLCNPIYRKPIEERTCNICEYVFQSRRRLKVHQSKFQGSCLSNFDPSKHIRASRFEKGNPKGLKRDKKVCKICAKVFDFAKSLQEHSKIVHGESMTPNYGESAEM